MIWVLCINLCLIDVDNIDFNVGVLFCDYCYGWIIDVIGVDVVNVYFYIGIYDVWLFLLEDWKKFLLVGCCLLKFVWL